MNAVLTAVRYCSSFVVLSTDLLSKRNETKQNKTLNNKICNQSARLHQTRTLRNVKRWLIRHIVQKHISDSLYLSKTVHSLCFINQQLRLQTPPTLFISFLILNPSPAGRLIAWWTLRRQNPFPLSCV